MKISEKITKILADKENEDKTYYSFEYFPARTEAGKINM